MIIIVDELTWEDIFKLIPDKCKNKNCDECDEDIICDFIETIYNDIIGRPQQCNLLKRKVMSECLTCDKNCPASLNSKLKHKIEREKIKK